jgi:hypothetical protein
MVSALSLLTGAHLVNLFVIAALVCILVALFGGAKETMAANTGFRAVAGMTGVLLLFCIYGIYLPYAARNPASNDPEDGRPTETQSAPPQQAVAKPAQSLPQQPAQSGRPAQSAPSSTQGPPTRTEKPTLPVVAKEEGSRAQQQQSAQPSSAPQAAAGDLFSGRWKNDNPKSANILLLKVEERSGEITVRAWGQCPSQQANRGRAGTASQYCDWGTGHGVVRNGAATVTWQEGTVLRRMKLLRDAGNLRVVLDSAYAGHPPQHTEAHLAKTL